MTAPELSLQMALRANVLLVGIGSDQGDDQVGWDVVHQLQQRFGSETPFRTTAVPLDLMDWMKPESQLHIVDACDGSAQPGHLWRWDWLDGPSPADSMHVELRGRGTHDYGIIEVLTLAQQLGRLPKSVTIWGIQGQCFATGRSISPQVAVELNEAAEVIAKELIDA